MTEDTDTPAVTPQLFRSADRFSKPIEGGKTKRIVMKTDRCSFLNQVRWISLCAVNGGIDIRLTLADPATVTVLNDATGKPTLSHNYQLQNIVFSASMCTIDSTPPGDVLQAIGRGREPAHPLQTV